MKNRLSILALMLVALSAYSQETVPSDASLVQRKSFNDIDSVTTASCSTVELPRGGMANLSVELTIEEESECNGFQFDLNLPEGISFAKEGDAYLYQLSDRYPGDSRVVVKDFGDGHYRLMAFSMDNSLLTGGSGEIISLTLAAADTIETDSCSGEITNFRLSTVSGITMKLPDINFDIVIPAFILGDVNHDDQVDVSDVMLTVNKVLAKEVTDFYMEEADINGDGELDVTDVMSIVWLVLNNGS